MGRIPSQLTFDIQYKIILLNRFQLPDVGRGDFGDSSGSESSLSFGADFSAGLSSTVSTVSMGNSSGNESPLFCFGPAFSAGLSSNVSIDTSPSGPENMHKKLLNVTTWVDIVVKNILTHQKFSYCYFITSFVSFSRHCGIA